MPVARVLRAFPLLFLVLVGSCSHPTPPAQGGTLDLSRWDFEGRGPAPLDGQWDFYWGQKVESLSALHCRPGTEWVPGYWNTRGGALFSGQGATTYHIHVVLPPQGAWSLFVPEISCSWTLVANGVLVGSRGSASLNPLEYRPLVRSQVVRLPPGSEFDLFLYVVNLTDRMGGIRDSFRLGPEAFMERQMHQTQFGSAFVIGGILVMALFNLVIFFLQRQRKSNLWLAVFSTFVAIRTLCTGPRIVYDLWPGMSFEVLAPIEFLCIFGATAAFIYYFKHLFPGWWPARIFVPFLLYTALFAILLFLLPIDTYAQAFTAFYELPLALVIAVFVAISGWAVRRKQEDGLLVFAGVVFLFVAAMNDIVYQFVPLAQGYLLGPFLFLFLVVNSFILSRQLAKDYTLSRAQAVELQKLDKMKDDFLARVSHELRTPLHGMIGILDAFRMGDFGPLSTRQMYHLGLLSSSSKRLLTMVNSILDFSNLKKEPLTAEAKPILLKQAVDFLLPSFYPGLKPGIALVNRLSDQLPAALGDELRLEQALQRIVQNAVQHTTHGTIAVEAEVKEQQIVLSIRDTGSGIPSEKMAQLFTPFHQVNDVDTRATGGLGLGLAISRQLVQQMGGQLTIESQEGVGTTVTVSLPVCPPGRLNYFQAPRLDRTFQTGEDSPSEPLPNGDGGDLPPSKGPRVLIVDDEPVNLLILRTFLNRIGYQVLEAVDGAQALEIVEHHTIDLMILDIMMPGMSGYEVCRRIRERFAPARLPILLLTAKNEVEDLLRGYRSGASDFLTKPFQREELRARMELHLKVSQAARSGQVLPNKA